MKSRAKKKGGRTGPLFENRIKILEEVRSSEPDRGDISSAGKAPRRLCIQAPCVVCLVVSILEAEANCGVRVIHQVHGVLLLTLSRARADRVLPGLAQAAFYLAIVEACPDRVGEVVGKLSPSAGHDGCDEISIGV